MLKTERSHGNAKVKRTGPGGDGGCLCVCVDGVCVCGWCGRTHKFSFRPEGLPELTRRLDERPLLLPVPVADGLRGGPAGRGRL